MDPPAVTTRRQLSASSDLSIDSERFSFLRSYLKRQGSSKSSLADLLPGLPSLPADNPSPLLAVNRDVAQPEDVLNMSPIPVRQSIIKDDFIAAMSPIVDHAADYEDEETFGGEGKRQRKIQWTHTEDIAILAAARQLGSQWDRIAAKLPGRTADAVRNRYHRLQKSHYVTTEEGRSVIDGALAATGLLDLPDPASVPPQTTPEGPASGPKRGVDHGRSAWTTEEDELIMSGVEKFGCKWRKIAETLSGRSDSSIRNRWVRLQQQKAAESGAVAAQEPPRTPGPGGSAAQPLFSFATPASTSGTPAGLTQRPDGVRELLARSGSDLDEKAVQEALAQLAGSAEPSTLPLGLDAPTTMIDLGAFCDVIATLQDESMREGDSVREEVGPDVEDPLKPANHSAPPGLKLASAFLATFAALAISKMGKQR